MKRLPKCLSCGSPLTRTFLDLGSQPLANALIPCAQAYRPERLYPLHARVCDHCLLVQVEPAMTPQEIFDDYPYFSSFSETWLAHCAALAADLAAQLRLGEQSRVVEIGSNDGALLACFSELGIAAIGVEPAGNVAQAARDRGLSTEIAFFSADTARKLVAAGWRADLIVGTNVLGQAPDIDDFISGVRMLLKPGGVFAIEFPHLLNLIREVQFDTIYHEHFTYISLTALQTILERHGLVVTEVAKQAIHGGSLRVLAAHADSTPTIGESVARVLGEEAAAGLGRPSGYEDFPRQVDAVCDGFASFLAECRREGRSVVGYGAAAKGATFLNHVGATSADIAFVVDRNPAKQGRLLPGSRIPVHPIAALIAARPDYVLILPWNLRDEVISQLPEVAGWAGRFVTAIPRLEVYG